MVGRILYVSGDVGSGEERYLLDAGTGETGAPQPVPRGQVLDLSQGRLFPPFNLESILARGYWEPFTGDQSILLSLLRQVKQS